MRNTLHILIKQGFLTTVQTIQQTNHNQPYTRQIILEWGGVAWVAHLTRWRRRSWVQVPSKAPVVSLSKKLYPYCLVMVGSRIGFERDFTIKLNLIEGLMEGWLKCQISPLVKYRQNQNNRRSILWFTPAIFGTLNNPYWTGAKSMREIPIATICGNM